MSNVIQHKRFSLRYGNWPSKHQELLVRAAITRSPKCGESWRQWSSEVIFDDIDYASARMLSLAYYNLSEHGIDDPNLPRMKGMFRRTWYKNQVLLNRVTDIVRCLQKNDIDVLVIKGVPLTVQYYQPLGRRQMYDLDVLVKPDDARRTIRILELKGWKHMNPDYSDWSDEVLALQYATHLKDENGIELDLHWYALSSCRYPSADRSFWSRSMPIVINGLETKTIDSIGHFFHVCIHGVFSHNTCPMRWVTDAMTILQSESTFDWSEMESQIRERRMIRPMGDVIRYLQTRFNAPIPQFVNENLATMNNQKRETLELWAGTRRTRSSLAAIIFHWTTYVRRTEGNSGVPSVKEFFHFLKCIWMLDQIWDLPLEGVRKVTRRFVQQN